MSNPAANARAKIAYELELINFMTHLCHDRKSEGIGRLAIVVIAQCFASLLLSIDWPSRHLSQLHLNV